MSVKAIYRDNACGSDNSSGPRWRLPRLSCDLAKARAHLHGTRRVCHRHEESPDGRLTSRLRTETLHLRPGYVRPSGPCNVATIDEQMPQTKSEAWWSSGSTRGTTTSGQMASQVRHQIRGHTSSIDGRCVCPSLLQQERA